MAGHKPVAVDELYIEISRALSNEVAEIEESIDIAANIATKNLLSAIRENSPVKTGEYKKGWKRKKLKHSFVVYNSKKAGLTHLLEFGHKIAGGTKEVKGIPHIKKNEEKAVESFEEMCVAIVSEGVRLKKSDISTYTE